MADYLPITEETIEKYGDRYFADLITDCHRLEQRLEGFKSMMMSNDRSA